MKETKINGMENLDWRKIGMQSAYCCLMMQMDAFMGKVKDDGVSPENLKLIVGIMPKIIKSIICEFEGLVGKDAIARVNADFFSSGSSPAGLSYKNIAPVIAESLGDEKR